MRINTNPTSGQFLEEVPLAAEAAASLWGNVSTRLGHLNAAILLSFCTTTQAVLGSFGIRHEQPFSKPATNSRWNSHPSLEDRFKQPPFFWMRLLTKLCGPSEFEITSDFRKFWFTCGVSFIHFSFCWGVLVKNVDHDLMFTSIKRRKHLRGVRCIFCSHCNFSQTCWHSTGTAVFAVGDSSRVSIDDVQEEVSGVVVGLTGVSFQLKTAFIYVLCRIWWSNESVMFVPMSEKYAKALCAGPW